MAMLTPYKAQKELIVDLMEKNSKLRSQKIKPKVATITDSQGQCLSQCWLMLSFNT